MISPILIPDVSSATADYSSVANDYLPNIYDNVGHNNTNFTVSMWIYIKDWEYNYDYNKILFNKFFYKDGKEDGQIIYSPIIYLDKYNNDLIYKTHIYGDDGEPKLVTCRYNNIAIQSWVNIVFSVEDKTVNLYINGSLAKKCNFENINYQGKNYKLEILPRGKHHIDDVVRNDEKEFGLNGFSGEISKLQYISKTITFSEIRKIYENGPYN